MKTNTHYIFILLVLFLLSDAITASAQDRTKPALRTVESVVVDGDGNPVSGAVVYGDEGTAVAVTDNTGRFRIAVSLMSELYVEAEGFEPLLLSTEDYANASELQLSGAPLLESAKDRVNIAFDRVKKRDITNAVSVINPAEVMKYDNIESIQEALSGRVTGMLGSGNIRGLGAPLYIVDGLPRDISNLDLSEIEQITVLKDINSAILYGSAAVNGVVLITTKRGEAFKKKIDVTGYYGVSTPVALPEFLSSAEYMDYNNRARINDGLQPLYDEETINNFRSGNPYRYPNVDYLSSDYIKNIRPYWKTMLELSGGNDRAVYYANAGWEHTGSYLNFGEGKNAKGDRFNIRGNVDMNVSSWIKTALDASAVFYNTKSPRGVNWWGTAATVHPHLFTPLLPIELIDPENQLLLGRKNDIDGKYLLGGNASNLTNAIGSTYSAGYTERFLRNYSFNNRIDFDLRRILEGLAFHTNISFDFYTIYDQAIQNEYAVYEPVWSYDGSEIIDLIKYGNDTRPGIHYAGNSTYQRRLGYYGMLDYKKTYNDVHQFSASLIGYGNNYKITGDLQGTKHFTGGLRATYIYNKKYLADFSGAYVHSVKLPKGNRGGFSPSLGLAWIVSSEDVFKSIRSVDYLKLRLSAGILNSDQGIDGFYYYDNRYGSGGGYTWFDGERSNSGTVSQNGGNMNLAFEKRKEVNIGLESILFNKHLFLDANVFFSSYYDQITRPSSQYPSFFANFVPYENFDENTYKGAELGLLYKNNIGRLRFELGSNILYADSKVKKRDEIYADTYRCRTGKPVDARFGLQADGFFQSQEEIDNHAYQAFGAVMPGDIKYVDQNNDGIIDGNDEVYIGRWQSPLSYGVNLKLSYGNVTFFAHGTGRSGADGYITNDYYWIDGNDKYSVNVKNMWTEETKATATLPRLSSQANPNNYRASTFWLYKDDYFTLDRVQLTYSVPRSFVNNLKMQHISLFIDGANLFTLSKNREIRELNIGGEPYSRYYTAGIKATF